MRRVPLLLIFGLFATTAGASAKNSRHPELSQCGVSATVRLPRGDTLKIHLALSDTAKITGLSGIPGEAFGDEEALLMVFLTDKHRAIHMGNTHFNLDVFFLNNDLTVVGLQRNLSAHPGKTEPPLIEYSRWMYTRHILEMRSGTEYANQIKHGMQLEWTSRPSLKAIERCMADVRKQTDNGVNPKAR